MMRVRFPLVSLLAVALFLFTTTRSQAQGAIRLIPWHFEKVVDDGDFPTAYYGLGYDHDLNKRLSMGVETMFSGEITSLILRYRSAYHFSDNDEGGSAYIGSMVAMRKLEEGVVSKTLFPVGMRLGFRGSLPGSFADIFVGGQYQIGAGGDSDPRQSSGEAAPLSFIFGLHFGFGWEGRED